MRLLLLLILAGVAAYFTVPTREAHEAAAREFLQTYEPSPDQQGISLESIGAFVQGMFAGQGRYENLYLLSKYSVDMPGAAFLECYGAYTFVHCQEVTGSGSS